MSDHPRDILRSLFDAAVDAAQPGTCLPPHLPEPPEGKIIVLASGKAAGSMAAAAEHHYLETLSLPPERIEGLAIARYGYGRPTRRSRPGESRHPVTALSLITL